MFGEQELATLGRKEAELREAVERLERRLSFEG